MARLAQIRRHPVKSVGGEDLSRVSLTAERRLPGDREWAVLTDRGERIAEARPDAQWLPKSAFLNTATSQQLTAVKGGWSGDMLDLQHPTQGRIQADPTTGAGALIDWLRPLWPQDRGEPVRLMHSTDGWTDDKEPFISILSLSSLAALEQVMGQGLDIERWRGNLWIEGWEPFTERELIGKTLRIGSAELQVIEHIGRCAAPSGNATTGKADCDMLAVLRENYCHTDFGVFAKVIKSGEIALGDEVQA